MAWQKGAGHDSSAAVAVKDASRQARGLHRIAVIAQSCFNGLDE